MDRIALSAWMPNHLYCESLKYFLGRDVAMDYARAFALNAEAADAGHSDAILSMGWFYLNGIGVARDVKLACKWYRESARRGKSKAMFSLGQIAYDEGDYLEALRWFERALKKGHHRSGYFIGKLHWKGRGMNKDKKKAIKYFHAAASHKVKEAQRVYKFLTRSL